jgi:hypothetical protein
MAIISIDLGAATPTNRVLDAFSATYGYPDPAFPGETKAAFAKRQMVAIIKRVVRDYESLNASRSAAASAAADVDANINPA